MLRLEVKFHFNKCNVDQNKCLGFSLPVFELKM